MYRADKESLSAIAHRYNLDLIVIFGSQVRGRDVSGSDVDVAVRFVRREWGNVDLELDLLGDLGEAIEGDLDVAFLNGAAPLLLYQVACTGVPLYEQTPGDFALFQSYAARRYYDSQKFFAAQDRYLRENYGS
jgi:predicted nucleotidyltransferase